jgi:hypothetical protein
MSMNEYVPPEYKKDYEDWQAELRKQYREKQKQNAGLLRKRLRRFNKRHGPRVGDWIILTNGVMTRFTHDWGIWKGKDLGIQIGDRERSGECGSFYLGDGYCSYSGSLDPCVMRKNIKRTNKKKLGRVWFFDHDHACADNGVDFRVKLRVYREVD